MLQRLTAPVSDKDAKIISQVVEFFAPKIVTETEYQELKLHILKVFGTDITPDHYIMLGQVIGLRAFADNEKRKKSNPYNYGSSHN